MKDRYFTDQKFYTRRYFIAKLGCRTTKEANAFYYYVSRKNSLKALSRDSSSVHLMYMSSIILALYAFFKIYDKDLVNAAHLLGFSILIFVGGFLTDRNVEKFDYQQIRTIELSELKLEWDKFQEFQKD
jgi:hypothetical protein